jgi:predicted flap endonuclease-1-like 5' DNA nuclease
MHNPAHAIKIALPSQQGSISIHRKDQHMAYKISEIEGIGPVYSEKLGAAGIATTDDLLRLCANAKGRAESAKKPA